MAPEASARPQRGSPASAHAGEERTEERRTGRAHGGTFHQEPRVVGDHSVDSRGRSRSAASRATVQTRTAAPAAWLRATSAGVTSCQFTDRASTPSERTQRGARRERAAQCRKPAADGRGEPVALREAEAIVRIGQCAREERLLRVHRRRTAGSTLHAIVRSTSPKRRSAAAASARARAPSGRARAPPRTRRSARAPHRATASRAARAVVREDEPSAAAGATTSSSTRSTSSRSAASTAASEFSGANAARATVCHDERARAVATAQLERTHAMRLITTMAQSSPSSPPANARQASSTAWAIRSAGSSATRASVASSRASPKSSWPSRASTTPSV